MIILADSDGAVGTLAGIAINVGAHRPIRKLSPHASESAMLLRYPLNREMVFSPISGLRKPIATHAPSSFSMNLPEWVS
jgi:hypothetical protein